MAVDSLNDSLHFYRDVLGMRMSDWIRPQPERGVESHMNIAFLHCNPRHHTLAFWETKMPKRLHHFMLQVNVLDDVCATYYLCQQRGVPIDLSLGRHTNDKMLSFYMKSPFGFDVEFGWGAIEIDDETWTVQLHTNGSSWRIGRINRHFGSSTTGGLA
jgi:catechol 2,3-dioxygenase-like lactoylglutathione lyase family enzyme